MIRNTSTDPVSPLLYLVDALGGGDGGQAIVNMEKRGQRELVNSDRLPTEIHAGGIESPEAEADFVSLGFTFGDPDPDDPLFRPANLPPGWKRAASDHDMWSHILDEKGRQRVAIFYKAAFYDRRAFMRLETPHSYCWDLIHSGGTPVLDEWITAETAIAELTKLREQELKYGEQETAATAQRLIDQLSASAPSVSTKED